MNPVEVSQIAKSFGSTQAVAEVSFEVQRGEIFGLLGPNGAGKTTTIRIMLDIFKPDRGTVFILGGSMTDEKKARIGYMPEERGLYQDVTLERCLLYLASLKDVPDKEARQRLAEFLERFDLAEHKNKKVKELSKGMQQKAQIIITLLHQPELVVIDEPFTALDPLNVQLVKDLMCDLRQQGVTIIMSTHQMHQVEEMCQRILLIDHGSRVLYGPLDEIRRQFASNAVEVDLRGELDQVPGVERLVSRNGGYRLLLQDGVQPEQLLKTLVNMPEITVERFERVETSLDEIFVRVVGRQVTNEEGTA